LPRFGVSSSRRQLGIQYDAVAGAYHGSFRTRAVYRHRLLLFS
jgi:hypothetical protein